MNEINDSELIMLFHEKNEDAEEIILTKYNYIIKKQIKNYEEEINKLKIDKDYIYGECMEVLSIALKKYSPLMEASFYTFANVLIIRRIKQIILHFCRKKNRNFEDSLSLDAQYTDSNFSLMDYIKDNNAIDPLNETLESEKIKEITGWIKTNLSDYEKEVYNLLLKGLSYKDIGEKLGKSFKQIDNTIQRIRNKMKIHEIDIILLENA